MTSDARIGKSLATIISCLAAGAVLGGIGTHSLAQMAPPTEHKNLRVEALGIIPEKSMNATIGLTGYKLQMREITIEPGGQIAKHSHASRPGLVKVIGGTWIEGRPDGEVDFPASAATAVLEDENTTHWFWNRGNEPASAIVCDIVPVE